MTDKTPIEEAIERVRDFADHCSITDPLADDLEAILAWIERARGEISDLIDNTRYPLFGLHGVAECSEDDMYGTARALLAEIGGPK